MLTIGKIKKAEIREKDYKLADGNGLYLLVRKTGAKYWRFKYRLNKKEKLLSFGVYPEVSLQEARDRRDDARRALRDGIDPGKDRARPDKGADFKTVAEEWLKARGPKSETGDQRLHGIIYKDLIPQVGDEQIKEITPTRWLEVIRKIENRGAITTAQRANQYGGQIFRFGIASGKCSNDPSRDIKDALATPKQRHFAAVTDPKKFGQLLRAIDTYEGSAIVQNALKLSPLLFCRPGELRHLEWSDIDWEQKRIEIPGDRMKGGEPHIIPLSKQAIKVLEHVRDNLKDGDYVFYSQRGPSRPMSENAVRVALRTMGYDNDTMTPHGFRASARTLLDEVLEYPIEWIEQQLAHAVRDANGRAYNRTKHLKQRAEMMQRWADYCDKLKQAS